MELRVASLFLRFHRVLQFMNMMRQVGIFQFLVIFFLARGVLCHVAATGSERASAKESQGSTSPTELGRYFVLLALFLLGTLSTHLWLQRTAKIEGTMDPPEAMPHAGQVEEVPSSSGNGVVRARTRKESLGRSLPKRHLNKLVLSS
mmetsp:Transcript_25738/g.60071  ORF Transcript_25738/g.60071 Transcript_25738/m.60071 type:complete len:147 (+) Transcript_25738:91-531(+)